MLKFIKTLFTTPAPKVATTTRTHWVRDNGTGNVIYQGTELECKGYAMAFGQCWVEAA